MERDLIAAAGFVFGVVLFFVGLGVGFSKGHTKGYKAGYEFGWRMGPVEKGETDETRKGGL
jgi:hypothetical protein